MEYINPASSATVDSDNDGLTDQHEINIYHTDPNNPDTDGDGYLDGHEVANGYDPNSTSPIKLEKLISVSIADESLNYKLGPYEVANFKVSTGIKGMPTPTGDFKILIKKPVVDYKGIGYDYPNTKWNLFFKNGGYYIHGAYWHNNFGHPMSHGCVNVSYANMEALYKWADVGTKITIE